ncbi:hypothetical protein QTP81_08440 [Alteromonas sp. ASW11-36]|uniref:Uncharacterized protein n=1 Tax=Alteromonas arenosi TaxID=3055817 RepID=A0ABT7SWQ7_9ALTE|nr:hypothetical protein [Alteromonas sp. ASW11-36]MDM7860622.1 hypothetical protein [Alteromonas sp. ASW11-36]
MTQKKLTEAELLSIVDRLGKDPSYTFGDLEPGVQEQLLELQQQSDETNPILVIQEPKKPDDESEDQDSPPDSPAKE